MKNLDFSGKYKKALLLGTGGGNDIVSTMLIAEYLMNQGIQCDVAGVLSPGAIHEFNGEIEQPINKLEKDARRYIASNNRCEISFIDSILPDLSKRMEYKVDQFYDFSTKFGTSILEREINHLINENGYDLFLEVDVGGDILGRKKDKTLLSPLMDFTSLYLLDKVCVDSYLVEFGLGTDGELRKAGMLEILEELRTKNVLLSEGEIDNSHTEVKRFRELYGNIANVRAGNTGRMTLKTLDIKGTDQDLVSQYYSKWVVGNMPPLKNYFDVTIPYKTFGKVYLMDGKKLPSLRTETAISYESALEQFVKIKSDTPEWKTELDMCYVDGNYILTPSLQLEKAMREEIIKYGLKVLVNGNAKSIIILEEDSELISERYYRLNTGKFEIFALCEDECVKTTAEKIIEYSNYV